MGQKTVLVIDDDRNLTQMLEEYLCALNYSVLIANDGQEGLDMARSQRDIDVILLDVMMPKKDGFEVLRELRSTHVTPVIMLTARGDDYDRVLGLEFGADDYMPKPFNHRELSARINAIIRRRNDYDERKAQQPLQVGELHIDPNTQTAHFFGQPLTLTGTEFATLNCLALQSGNLCSKQVLSEQVLGRKLMEFDRSIDVHVSNLRKKFAEIDPNPVIKTVRGAGYMLVSPS